MTETRTGRRTGSATCLTVRIGGRLHAIPVDVIEEVLPELPVEPVAGSPEDVPGLIFVRGHLLPVVSAAGRLGLTDAPRPADPHLICIRVGDRLVAVEVDEAVDLMDLSSAEHLPAEGLGAEAGAVCSVVESGGQIIRILDPSRLFPPALAAAVADIPRERA